MQFVLGNVATHNVVNHPIDFVDPVTGVHTQNIESYWNRVKTKLKRLKGCRDDQLATDRQTEKNTHTWDNYHNPC